MVRDRGGKESEVSCGISEAKGREGFVLVWFLVFKKRVVKRDED